MEVSDIGIGEEHIGRGGDSVKDCADDVGHEMQATMNGIFAEDGDLSNVSGGCHG